MSLRFTSNSIENEDLLMLIIIRLLQDNGGELTKQELTKLIAEDSDEWNKYVYHVNKSAKSGKEWGHLHLR